MRNHPSPRAVACGEVVARKRGACIRRYTANPAVLEIDDVDVDAVNGSTVYGISGGQAVAASRTGESFSIQVFTTNSTGGTTAPVAVTNGQAFVVTEKVRRSFLYALPHKD